MPRTFVNGLGNFSIQGGMVSFTLQDQALRAEGGQMRPAPPEPVGEFIMREEDFAKLVQVLSQHLAAYRQSQGQPAPAPAPAMQAPAPAPAMAPQQAKPAPQGFKIKPKA